MNYTLKDANKIRVGDTLTLEDGTVHEAVKDERNGDCGLCRISLGLLYIITRGEWRCGLFPCSEYSFHFKRINP